MNLRFLLLTLLVCVGFTKVFADNAAWEQAFYRPDETLEPQVDTILELINREKLPDEYYAKVSDFLARMFPRRDPRKVRENFRLWRDALNGTGAGHSRDGAFVVPQLQKLFYEGKMPTRFQLYCAYTYYEVLFESLSSEYWEYALSPDMRMCIKKDFFAPARVSERLAFMQELIDLKLFPDDAQLYRAMTKYKFAPYDYAYTIKLPELECYWR